MIEAQPTTYSAVIFDLDGTILDTLSDLADAVNHTLASHQFPQRTIKEIASFLGNGVEQLMRLSLPQDCPEDKLAQYTDEMRQYYAAHCDIKTAPYPGIVDLVKKLREKGVACAVVSNKIDAAVKPLVARYFPGLIDIAVGERENIRRKPAPDALFSVMEQLGVKASQCVYVGDSEVDFETAKNAGIECILVSWGFRDKAYLKNLGATRIADTASQLESMLGLL